MEGGLDRDDGIETGHDVGERHADLLRCPAGLAGQVHDAAHALHDEVVPGARRIGAVLTEAGDRAIDQAWICSRQAVVIQAVASKAAQLEILDDDIGPGDQRAYLSLSLGRGEVGNDRGLAAIGGVEIGGVLRPVGIGDERRPPAAGIVTLGAFDLHHLRAKIGQHLARPGARQDAGQLDDLQTREGGGFGHQFLPKLRLGRIGVAIKTPRSR